MHEQTEKLKKKLKMFQKLANYPVQKHNQSIFKQKEVMFCLVGRQPDLNTLSGTLRCGKKANHTDYAEFLYPGK